MANRPQPSFPEPDTQHFWDGCKEGRAALPDRCRRQRRLLSALALAGQR